MIKLLVLLLATVSLDACLVMAREFEEQPLASFATLVLNGLSKIKGAEKYKDSFNGAKTGLKFHKYGHKLYDLIDKQVTAAGVGTPAYVDAVAITGSPTTTLPVVTADITATSAALTGSCATGMGVPRQVSISLLARRGTASLGYLPSATLVECPAAAAAAGGGASAVLGLGRGGVLADSVPTFSYFVAMGSEYINTVVWFGPAQPGLRPAAVTPVIYNPKNPNLYYVSITGIWIGALEVMQTPLEIRQDGTGGAYLSTTDLFTYLERGVYDSLKAALFQSLLARGVAPGPPQRHPDQLCYIRPALSAVPLPQISVVFAGNGVMELGKANVMYMDGLYDCLSILPTPSLGEVTILGSLLQIGRQMTLQKLAAGGTYTLTQWRTQGTNEGGADLVLSPLPPYLSLLLFLLHLTFLFFFFYP